MNKISPNKTTLIHIDDISRHLVNELLENISDFSHHTNIKILNIERELVNINGHVSYDFFVTLEGSYNSVQVINNLFEHMKKRINSNKK